MSILKIYKPDDSGEYLETEVHTSYRYSINDRVSPISFRSHHEPTVAALKQWVENTLRLNVRGRGEKMSEFITIGDEIKGLKLLINKIGTRYHLMGEMASKDTIVTAIARTIYKASFEDDNDKLYAYMLYHLRLPANVSYALENRAPFHWYKKGQKVDVRFNVKMIGPDMCAMEISDGIWGEISVKQMNIYMNYYWKGQMKGSWKLLSPRKLWKKIMGKEPSDGQLKMMKAFLEQNRTDDIVQNRALELVQSLEKQYPSKLAVKWNKNKKGIIAMAIRGKIADWIITDNEFKSDIQAVSTFLFSKDNGTNDRLKYQTGILKGPICIDNMTKNSSVGDQFAARALALLNDNITVKIVNTISRYLGDCHTEGQNDCRISFDSFRMNDWKLKE
tara:strand:- start:1737 stop:2906 length:1170 start_codon:yes stop_codon:yes gene_type:complete